MPKITFFSVLKSNIKCAFCKTTDCPVKYYPERKNYQYVGGRKVYTLCEKDVEKKQKEDRERKLP